MVATDGHRLAHIEKLGETLEGVTGEKKTLIPRKALSRAAIACSRNTEAETLEFADDEHDALLPHRRPRPHQPQAHRPVPQLRSRPAARQQQVRHRPQRRSHRLHPARRAVRRRALRRHQDAPRAERAQALLLLHRRPANPKTPSRPPTTTTPSSSASIASTCIDFLKAIGNTGEVRLEFKDAQSAGQMRPEDANDEYKYRYIIMPMRI